MNDKNKIVVLYVPGDINKFEKYITVNDDWGDENEIPIGEIDTIVKCTDGVNYEDGVTVTMGDSDGDKYDFPLIDFEAFKTMFIDLEKAKYHARIYVDKQGVFTFQLPTLYE